MVAEESSDNRAMHSEILRRGRDSGAQYGYRLGIAFDDDFSSGFDALQDATNIEPGRLP
jgi:hypothetical protein